MVVFCPVDLLSGYPETLSNVVKREEINGADASRIRWRRIVNVNVTIEIRYILSSQCHRVGRPSVAIHR